MLVLSRKMLESIVIGTGPDQIVLTIVDIKGNQIRVGVDAPRHIQVMRAELLPCPPQPQTKGTVKS